MSAVIILRTTPCSRSEIFSGTIKQSGATASRPRRTTTTSPSSRFSRTSQEEGEEEVAALLPEDKPHKPQSTEPTAFDRCRGLLQC